MLRLPTLGNSRRWHDAPSPGGRARRGGCLHAAGPAAADAAAAELNAAELFQPRRPFRQRSAHRQGRAAASAPAAPKLTAPLPRAQITKMRTLLFVLFALVVSCSALAAAPEAEASTRSAINLAQSAPAAAPAGAAAPAKPFYDPLLMYNPYMCATPAAPPRAQ